MARRFKRSFRRSNGGKRSSGGMFGLNLSPATLLGAAVGFSNLDDRLPKEIVLAAAVAPVKTGKIGAAARGIVLGNLIQGFIGRSNSGNVSGGWGL